METIAEIDAPDRALPAEGLNRRRFRLVARYHELERYVWYDDTETFELTTIYLTSDLAWDWTRLRNGVLNASLDHDNRAEYSIGIVERAEMEDETIFGQLAFNDLEAGRDAWARVEDGTLAGISPEVVLKFRKAKAPDGMGGFKRVGYPYHGEIVDVSLVANPDDADLYITKMEHRGELVAAADAPLPEIAGVAFEATGDILSLQTRMAFATGDSPGAISDTSYRGEGEMTPEEMAAKMAQIDEQMAAFAAQLAEHGNGNGNGNGEDDKAREEMSAAMSLLRDQQGEIQVEMARQREITTAAVAAGHPELAAVAITEGVSVQAFTMGLLQDRYENIQVALGRSRPAGKNWFDYGALCEAVLAPGDTAAQGAASFEMSVMKEHENVPSADKQLPPGVAYQVAANTQVMALPSRREWHDRFHPDKPFVDSDMRAKMAFETGNMTGAISDSAMFDFSVPYPMDYATERLIGMCYYREGLMDNVRYPVTIAGIQPTFVAEGVDGGEGEPRVIEQNLTPHELAREVPITRRSTIQTGGWSMDETFRVAEIDFKHKILEAIFGTVEGANGAVTVAAAPTDIIIAGLLNKANAGIPAEEQIYRGAVTQPAGLAWPTGQAVPDYDELLELITALSNRRAPYESRGYVLSPGQVQPYSRTPQYVVNVGGENQNRAAAAGEMILSGPAGGERMGRFPAVETTLLPTATPTIIAGVWAAMNVATWNTPLFWIDALTRTGQVIFHAFHLFDVSYARSDYFYKAVRA